MSGDTKFYGRNSEGKFNNHENFLKMKAKVNEAERSSLDMFETINEKLDSDDFI